MKSRLVIDAFNARLFRIKRRAIEMHLARVVASCDDRLAAFLEYSRQTAVAESRLRQFA
jgi:hypothetical protein